MTRLHAVSAETGRPVSVVPVVIQPGEQALCALPYFGRTATEFLTLALSGDIEYVSSDVNLTGEPITLFHGDWEESGMNAGYFWRKHLRFDATA